ncbi:hypothetical protein [Streptosporangium sp. H16]|uniref:hypothetical protein n=1 Tax=Streptosporangium sp. H16 TaxID=3444184 RepID=UPI003F78B366
MTTLTAPLRGEPLLAASIAAIEEAQALKERIKAGSVDPDPRTPITLWDQRVWRNELCMPGWCGTTLCLAGWAAQLGGGEWFITYSPDGPLMAGQPTDLPKYRWAPLLDYMVAAPGDPEHAITEHSGHRIIPVQAKAMFYLGLKPMICRDEDGEIECGVHHEVFLGHLTLSDLRHWYDLLYVPF